MISTVIRCCLYRVIDRLRRGGAHVNSFAGVPVRGRPVPGAQGM